MYSALPSITVMYIIHEKAKLIPWYLFLPACNSAACSAFIIVYILLCACDSFPPTLHLAMPYNIQRILASHLHQFVYWKETAAEIKQSFSLGLILFVWSHVPVLCPPLSLPLPPRKHLLHRLHDPDGGHLRSDLHNREYMVASWSHNLCHQPEGCREWLHATG